MRQDMKKVLTERPRFGHGRSYHEVRSRENRGDYEDLPSFQGMRAPHVSHWGGKEFSDHIMPLIRYLWSSVGRRWDDVWSEICEQVKSNNTVDAHLKGHVTQEIELHCVVIDGEVFTKPSGRYSSWRGLYKPSGLYVDPRDGIIKAGANDYHHSRFYSYGGGKKEPDPNIRYYDHGKAAFLDGIWYMFTYAVCQEPKFVIYFDENGEEKQKRITFPKFDEYHRTTVHTGTYHANKRQISSRDLKRLGLQNSR